MVKLGGEKLQGLHGTPSWMFHFEFGGAAR
jgi:hypothetical protein